MDLFLSAFAYDLRIYGSLFVCVCISVVCVLKLHVPANTTQLIEENVWNSPYVSDKSAIKV